MTRLTPTPDEGDRPSQLPQSKRFTYVPPQPSALERYLTRTMSTLGHAGALGRLTWGALRAVVRRPFELRATIYQMEALGVRSLGIASVVALFTGLVMATQFAYGLQKFGGMEYTGRIVGLSFARELAPALTALVVGGRIGSGIAAEIGSMAVTEQVDAIRALGADPIKKLVVPRLFAAIIVMPLLAAYALVLGFLGAMFVMAVEFGQPSGFFLGSAIDAVRFADYFSGLYKTPMFGAVTALLGCHFGLQTRGGTEGVGNSTTRSVVAISIGILVTDFVMTKISLLVWPS